MDDMDELEAKAMAKAGLAGEGVSHGLKVESATEAWLGSVGGAERLVFTDGGAVQVGFHTSAITRLCEAVAAMELRKKKPDLELLGALEKVAERLHRPRRPELLVHLTVPLALMAVALEPVTPVLGVTETED